jgi:mannose-1-phosphate guanylyltransferase
MSMPARNIAHRAEHQVHPATYSLSNRVALLLSGGDGRRLQELTTKIAGTPIPKQYCRLLPGSSLFEAAVSRARLFAPQERIYAVINERHLSPAKGQLGVLAGSNILVQPLNLDTGPGMIFALLCLERTHPDAVVAVFPTDHYIDQDWIFVAHVLRAVNTVWRMPEKIAILGISPDRPETGYGYILPAKRLKKSMHAYTVESFTEKPDRDTAQAIIAHGGLWNSFVMVFRLSRMLELLQKSIPDEFKKLSPLRQSPKNSAAIYKTLTPWNLSTEMLARIPQHLIVLKVANVYWSDWGTRESVDRTYRRLNLAPFWDLPESGA